MALRDIVKDLEFLRKKSRTQLAFDERLSQNLDDMIETMYDADGVGLAAPQVGILRRYCVIDVGDGLIELINPVIVEKHGLQKENEGCLSLPGQYCNTNRPMKVKVRANNRKGETIFVEGEGLKARALCHEIDHLDGILFIDRKAEE